MKIYVIILLLTLNTNILTEVDSKKSRPRHGTTSTTTLSPTSTTTRFPRFKPIQPGDPKPVYISTNELEESSDAASSDYGTGDGDFNEEVVKRLPAKNVDDESYVKGPGYRNHPKLVIYKDGFWTHPLVYLPATWENKDREPGQPRFPLYDPSYPNWEVGYPKRPGNKKNLYMFLPSPNDLNVDPEESDNGLQGKQFLSGNARNDPNKMSSSEVQRYKEEIKVGDLTQLLGTNLHIYQPSQYRLTDLGRRFMGEKTDDKEDKNLNPNTQQPNRLIPKLAPPEVVLAVAKESARLEASEPIDPEEFTSPTKNKALRSGEFWNSYWQEDIADPLALRSGPPDKNMESLKVKLSPGTPIYEYVKGLNKNNPKLLYVINKKE